MKFQVDASNESVTGFDAILEELKTERGLKSKKEAFELLYNQIVAMREAGKEKAKRTTAILQSDEKKSNYKGSSKERAILYINTLIAHNENSDELDRVYISPTLVEREAGINRMNGIKPAMDELSKKISAHHKKFNLTPETNRRFIDSNQFPRDENGKLIFIADILRKADVYTIFQPKKSEQA